MNSKAPAARLLVTLAAFVIVMAGVRAASSLITTFLLAFFIATIAAPGLVWLRRKKIPTAVILVVFVAIFLVLGMAVITLVGKSLNDYAQNAPAYEAALKQKLQQLIFWLEGKGMDVNEEMVITYLKPKSAFRLVGQLLGGLASIFSNAFLILLTVIFMLLEASIFENKLHAISGKSLTKLQTIIHNIRRYMAIKTIISIITGVLIALWLSVLGVKYALLWGLVAFLLNYIPNIGSMIAALPAVILAFVQFGAATAGLTALGYLAVNGVMGGAIEPRVMGRGLDLSPLVVFVSLVFWGWVLGAVGMLLSAPLTMCLKIMLESAEDTRWIGVLLSSSPPKKPATESP